MLCNLCAAVSLPDPPQRCYRCLAECPSALCFDCQKSTPLSGVWSACNYEGAAQAALHYFKFERARSAADLLAQAIVEQLPNLPSRFLVVPLPTASRRARQRGYDQAVELAKAISRKSGMSYKNLLARQGQTRQLGANRAQRQLQLARAWRIRAPDLVRDANILLIDDVLTTGATIESAAAILVRAGAKNICAATFSQKL